MKKILLVDDNPTNLKVLSESIVSCGWKILIAIDGEAAIQQAEQVRPDLILLDVMMPGIDGFETCRRLKSDPATPTAAIPVIFMTALSDTEDKVRGLRTGAVDYITKPFQAEEVIARISTHLNLQELRQRLAEDKALLEERVQQRTQELAAALEQLENSQLRLVQTGKMSMLGELTSGVIHEIKNHISLISGNTTIAQEYVLDVVDHLQHYRDQFPQASPEILAHAQKIDLDFLLEELPKILASMCLGSERTVDVIRSITTFSYHDNLAKMQPFNITSGLNSVLTILKHRLKSNNVRPEIVVSEQFDEELPLIYCHPGQLNQVFMNLIANSIDAVEETNENRSFEQIEQEPNRIDLLARVNYGSNHMEIIVRDNGAGIPDAIQEQIFQRSFTTKSVGKGTGLGLSLSRWIVEDLHEGRLSCQSLPGQLTEFRVELPLRPLDP